MTTTNHHYSGADSRTPILSKLHGHRGDLYIGDYPSADFTAITASDPEVFDRIAAEATALAIGMRASDTARLKASE
jgi:hypothetical protein